MQNKVVLFCTIFLLIIFSKVVNGQNLIVGKITDTSKAVLPYVNVSISGSDSLLFGTITDIQGSFKIGNIKPQNYSIKASCIGFNPYEQIIAMGNNDSIIITIELVPTSLELSEIVIQGKLIEQFADKSVYIVSHDEKKTASSAFDILKILPKVRVDMIQNSASTNNGQDVKILINGLNSDVKDLMTIPPDNILKIEFYDIVPGRFASENIGAVVNVITKEAVQGGDIFINTKNAVTTGFSDDLFSYKNVKNNNQVTLNYNLSYRKYKKRTNAEEYFYALDDKINSRNKIGKNSPMYYQVHNLDVRFVNRKSDNYLFCVEMKNSYFDTWRKDLHILSFNSNDLYQEGSRVDSMRQLNPSFSLYFFKKLIRKQEFSINIVPTFFYNNFSSEYVQLQNEDSVFYSYSNLKSNKYSIISETMYTKSFDNLKSNSGFIYSNQFIDQNTTYLDTEKIEGSSVLTDYYYYSEIVGRIKKIRYNIGLGHKISTFQNKKSDNSFNSQTFRPRISVGYDLSEYSSFKIKSSIAQSTPSLGALSNILIYTDSVLILTGNPDLKPYRKYKGSIAYSYTRATFQIYLDLNYCYSDQPILPFFEKKDNVIFETSENFTWEKQFAPELNIKLNPFKSSWLQFDFSYIVMSTQNKYLSTNSLVSNSYNGDLVLNYKNFSFSVNVFNSGKNLYGEYISRGEVSQTLQLQYKKNNLSCSIGLLQPFNESLQYTEEIVRSSVMYRYSETNIYDNGRMMYLCLTYNFSYGRKVPYANVNLSNQDNDSGVFKAK